MFIKELSVKTGVSDKTIRYYESIGLVVADRWGNGYRRYCDEHIHKLRFLQRARGLGFSVEECRSLLSLYEDKNRVSAEVKQLAQARLNDIDRKVKELRGMRAVLSDLIVSCHGDNRPDCPILDDLAGGIASPH